VREQYENVLVVLVDESGSFKELMKPDGAATKFLYDTVDHYFQARLASDQDLLIVAQLSGNRQALLFQGSPRDFRQRYSSAATFSQELERRSSGGGSRIYDGISDSIEFILNDPNLATAHLCLIILSDMEQNLQDGYTTNQRLENNLKAFVQRKGVMGIYFAEPQECIKWRQKLQKLSMRDFVVEASIHENPRRPKFE
jgi:hypothetical protein